MIKVKVICNTPTPESRNWSRLFPGDEQVWGRCTFTFNSEDRVYDWLVVYDELPTKGEQLACPRKNTMLMTVEPPSIKVYGSAYTHQFGAVLTSHEDWALPHENAIRSIPSLQWFYGWPMGESSTAYRGYDQIQSDQPMKQHDLSTVTSSKAMGHTLHAMRYGFVQALRERMPEVDVFGWGVKEIGDKAEALDPYRYHVAIENFQGRNHITEKLTDAYLGMTLPFYFGAPNAADYFPEESFIPIDIRDPESAIQTIRTAIENNEYEKRLPAIREAKRQVLDEHNMFAVLSRNITRLDSGKRGAEAGKIENRRVLRKRSPISAARYLFERYRVQSRLRRSLSV